MMRNRVHRGWHLTAIVVGLAAVVTLPLIVSTVERLRAKTREIRWLRARLTEKRELAEQQRAEMAQVAAAVDRVAWKVASVRERATQIRRLAQMKDVAERPQGQEDTDPPIDLTPGSARILEQLARLEGHTEALGDSMGMVTVLLQERASTAGASAPSLWPVSGSITSEFGERTDPYGAGEEMHPGVDIVAPYGTPVAAAGAGEIIFTGRDEGYGQVVIVAHGRQIASLYGHLSAIYAREGARVRRGDVIGAVGATGRVTGTHLHFEVRVNGSPVDPQRYLRDGARQVHARLAPSDLDAVGGPSPTRPAR